MRHALAERHLSAYLDQELVPGERRVVEAHLRTCDICRDELARLRRMKSLLGALPEVEPPAGLFEDAYRRIRAPRPVYAPVQDWLRAASRRPAVAVAAAMLVILLIALPLVKGRVDRLQAGSVGVDVYVREHAVLSAADPFVDRAYLGLLIGDANVALVGQRRSPERAR